ncbi:MAG: diguanylate cyclase (GGDEF)-like protein/PAS domain S-box-containing protein [Parasphingorhabdus sp.]
MNNVNFIGLKTVEIARSEILVVDDRPTTRTIVRSVLEDAGYRVVEASDGLSAIDLIKSGSPDLVLLDIVMPEMDGISTLQQIRQHWTEIELPVIMLTVKDSLTDMLSSLQMGATDFISKPINFDILLARLNTHVQRKHLADQIQEMRETLELKVKSSTQQLVEKSDMLSSSIEELSASESRFAMLYNDTPAVFMTLDQDVNLVSINQYGANFLGENVEAFSERAVLEYFHPSHHNRLKEYLVNLANATGSIVRQELMMVNHSGGHLWLRFTGRTQEYVAGNLAVILVGEDITESHQLAARLEYLRGHDELTGLLNRLELTRSLERLLESSQTDESTEKYCGALLYLDIDQFRIINDSYGHVFGDLFICELGRKLSALVGPSDLVARLGGDEFSIILTTVDETDARQVAERIRTSIESFRVTKEDENIGATVSIGLVQFDSATTSVAELLVSADTACYQAKGDGGNCVRHFKKQAESVLQKSGDFKWASQIQQILDTDKLEFFAQKIIPNNLRSQQQEIIELLIRVKKPNGGYLSNHQLISTIEEFRFGHRLDAWVIKNSFLQLSKFGFNDQQTGFRIAINVSGQSLGQQTFFNDVLEQMQRYKIPADRVCFEITETAAISNVANATDFITTVRKLGCHVALDDFGSGLSSYSYLKQFPADILKIDGSLIRNMEHDEIKLAIVDSIVRLAHRIDKVTVAEHVETQQAFDLLTGMGVNYLQGNFIGEAQPLASFFN